MRLAAFTCAMLFSLTADADPPTIVILKTKNSLMYVKVVASAKKVLGANARVIEINLDGKSEEESAAALRDTQPQVVLALGLPAARLAKKTATSVPLVHALVASPHAAGLDGSANVSFTPDPNRYVELIQSAVSGATKVGLIYNVENSETYVSQLRQVAEKAHLQLVTRVASSDRELPNLVRDLAERVEVFLVLPDQQLMTTESYRFIVQTTMEKRIPLITFSSELLSVGAMLSLSADQQDCGEKAADLVLQVLAGKSPVGLVALPEAIFDFNARSLELLGRTLPIPLMQRKGRRF